MEWAHSNRDIHPRPPGLTEDVGDGPYWVNWSGACPITDEEVYGYITRDYLVFRGLYTYRRHIAQRFDNFNGAWAFANMSEGDAMRLLGEDRSRWCRPIGCGYKMRPGTGLMRNVDGTSKFDTHIVTRAAGGGWHAHQRRFMENSMDVPLPFVYHQEKIGVIYKPPATARANAPGERAASRAVQRSQWLNSLDPTTEEVEVKSEVRVNTAAAAKPKRRSKGQANTSVRKLAAASAVEIGNPSPAAIDLTASSSDEEKQRGKAGGIPEDATSTAPTTAKSVTKGSKSGRSKKPSHH